MSDALRVCLSPMFRAVARPLVIMAVAAACSLPPKKSSVDPQSVARGKPLYLQNCAPCHGAAGEGNGPLASEYDPPPTNLVAGFRVSTRGLDVVLEIPHYSSRLIKERATTGNREMPAWNELLTEQEIDDIVAYLRHLIAAHKGS